MNDTEAFLKLDYSVLSIAKYDNISFSVLQKLIYCYYRDFYRSTNKPVYVSMSALATILGSDNRVTIQNSVKKLEVMGLLECVEANKGTSKKFIPKLLNLSLCTYTNSKKLRKGTNQDPERLVKPHKAEVKVKEEFKQSPMPTNEPEPVPPIVDVLEKPSISVAEVVEAVTVPHVDIESEFNAIFNQEVEVESLNQNVAFNELTDDDDEIPGVEPEPFDLLGFVDGTVQVLTADDYKRYKSQATLKGMELSDKCKNRHSHLVKQEEDYSDYVDNEETLF